MNAAQYRRLELQLSQANEFFLEDANLGSQAQEVKDDLQNLINKVVAARIRAEQTERRVPGSRSPW